MTDEINMRKTAKLLTEIEAFNSQWIERYIDAEKRGVSKSTKKKIREKLGKIGREHINKRFDEVSKDDLEEWVEYLKSEGDYAEATKTTYLKVAKPFFIWMHKQDDPSFASWIKPGNYRTKITANDIWTDDEMNAMRSVLKSPRDKAMFETLYESALRPMEFLALSKRDLEFDEVSIMIHVQKGKTGFPRDIGLLGNARPLLTQWVKNEHPLRNDSQFPLWVDMSSNSDYLPLQNLGLRKFTRRIAEEASKKCTSLKRKLEKINAYPYMFRHTRLTELAKITGNPFLLCEIAGWQQGSEMAAVYIHFSGRDQKEILAEYYGIKKETEKPKIRGPIDCKNCKEPNQSDATICWKCSSPLDTETAIKMLQDRTQRDKELKDELGASRASRKLVEDFYKRFHDITPEEFSDGLAHAQKIHREKLEKEIAETPIENDDERIKAIESGAPLKDGEIYRSRKDMTGSEGKSS